MKLLSIHRSFYFVSRNRYSLATYVMDILVSQAIAFDQSMGFQLLLNYYSLAERNISLKKSQNYIMTLAFIAIKKIGLLKTMRNTFIFAYKRFFKKSMISFIQILTNCLRYRITFNPHGSRKFHSYYTVFFNKMLWSNSCS